MAVSLFASGTQTGSSGGAEYSLASVDTSGTFRLWMDLSNMSTGHVAQVRVKGKVLTGGTKRGIKVVQMSGVQSTEEQIYVSDAWETNLSESDGLEFTFKLAFGSSVDFAWKVTKIN